MWLRGTAGPATLLFRTSSPVRLCCAQLTPGDGWCLHTAIATAFCSVYGVTPASKRGILEEILEETVPKPNRKRKKGPIHLDPNAVAGGAAGAGKGCLRSVSIKDEFQFPLHLLVTSYVADEWGQRAPFCPDITWRDTCRHMLDACEENAGVTADEFGRCWAERQTDAILSIDGAAFLLLLHGLARQSHQHVDAAPLLQLRVRKWQQLPALKTLDVRSGAPHLGRDMADLMLKNGCVSEPTHCLPEDPGRDAFCGLRLLPIDLLWLEAGPVGSTSHYTPLLHWLGAGGSGSGGAGPSSGGGGGPSSGSGDGAGSKRKRQDGPFYVQAMAAQGLRAFDVSSWHNGRCKPSLPPPPPRLAA